MIFSWQYGGDAGVQTTPPCFVERYFPTPLPQSFALWGDTHQPLPRKTDVLRGRIKEGAWRADWTGGSGWGFCHPPLNPLPRSGRGVCECFSPLYRKTIPGPFPCLVRIHFTNPSLLCGEILPDPFSTKLCFVGRHSSTPPSQHICAVGED